MLLQERLLTSPSGLTLSTQQTNGVLKFEEWWKEVAKIPRRSLSLQEKFIGLDGVPGSGKSTCIWTFLHRLMNRAEGKRTAIALAAPTHKAKTVLVDMAIENGIYGCKITTMASLLGVKADLDAEGEDEFKFNFAKLKIDGFDLVLADESSMCNTIQWEYIKSLPNCPPMILIGDIEQLRPVKGEGKSPVFREVKRWINLSEPFRYGGRIKDLVTAVKASRFLVNPYDYADGEQVQVLDQAAWLDQLADDIAKDETGKETRALAYTNDMVDWLNSNLHTEVSLRRKGLSASKNLLGFPVERGNIAAARKLFRWDVPPIAQFEVGMFLVFNKAISEWDMRKRERVTVVNSGTVVKVERVTTHIEHGLTCLSMVVHWNDTDDYGTIVPRSYNIFVLDKDQEGKFEEMMAELRRSALRFEREDHPVRRQIFRERAQLRDTFAHVSQIYAQTVHKSQGSGYRYVYAHLGDILKAGNADVVKELVYTAYSRAKEKLVICV